MKKKKRHHFSFPVLPMEEAEFNLMGTHRKGLAEWVCRKISNLNIGAKIVSVGVSPFAFLGIQIHEIFVRFLGLVST